MKNENIPDNTHDENERQNVSGNMYSYRDDNNQNVQETGAIRRSIGEGNPNLNNIQNNFGSGYNPNYINNGNVEIQYSQVNYNAPNINFFLYFTYFIIIVIEIVLIILLGIFFEYKILIKNPDVKENDFDETNYNYKLQLLKDINIMVFIGFGMLHSILRRNSWISITINMLVIAISVQFAFLFNFLWKNAFLEKWDDQTFDFTYLMKAIFISSSVLVTLGCVLGKLSIIQYIILAIFETFLSTLNYQLCEEKLKIIDYGGALYIHTFGAIFGIAVNTVLFCSTKSKASIMNFNHLNKSNYFSNLTSFLGIIILFSYFPTFNSALAQCEKLIQKGIYSTYLSLFGSVVGAFIISGFFNGGRFIFEEISYGSISGAIIISGCSTLCLDLWAPIVIGTLGASISVIFLSKVKPYFIKWGLQDTCNIVIIHGIMGLLGGFITPMFISGFNERKNVNTYITIIESFTGKNKRSFNDQAGIQIGGLVITIFISFIGGIATGYLMKISLCGKLSQYFTDAEFFFEEETNIFEYIEQNTAFNIDINNPSLFKMDYQTYNQISGTQDIRGSQPSY